MPFRDRANAGRRLAARLRAYRGEDAVVLALPRGGVPVGAEVARALALPLDIVVVRKLGVPDQPEVGMGAVAEGGAFYLDRGMVDGVSATTEEVERIAATQIAEVERRVRQWRGARPRMPLAGKIAIVVDDGIATGGTVCAALASLRSLQPRRIVLAVPVAPIDALAALAAEADEVVCLEPVADLGSVGAWYDDFRQVSDDEVATILAAGRTERADQHADEHADRDL